MAYDPGILEAALAAAVGDDPQLIADLRSAFLQSAAAHLAALRSAQDALTWSSRAQRLHSLAASFGALRVMAAAHAASLAKVADKRALNRIEQAIASMGAGIL